LYAPKKGKLLRNDISRKTNDLIDQGKKLTYDSWNGAKEAAESTFESANEFLNTGVEKIIDKTEKIKDAFRTGIDTYKDERRSGKNKGSLYNEVAEKK
jgi:gas vesicle protein